ARRSTAAIPSEAPPKPGPVPPACSVVMPSRMARHDLANSLALKTRARQIPGSYRELSKDESQANLRIQSPSSSSAGEKASKPAFAAGSGGQAGAADSGSPTALHGS